MIIKDNFEPILLEVNYSPCMKIYNKVDRPIKTNIFVDLLNIVGITPFSHEKNSNFLFKNKKRYIDGEYNDILCELSRPRGDFELIFPLRENVKMYKKYFINNIFRLTKISWIYYLISKKKVEFSSFFLI